MCSGHHGTTADDSAYIWCVERFWLLRKMVECCAFTLTARHMVTRYGSMWMIFWHGLREHHHSGHPYWWCCCWSWGCLCPGIRLHFLTRLTGLGGASQFLLDSVSLAGETSEDRRAAQGIKALEATPSSRSPMTHWPLASADIGLALPTPTLDSTLQGLASHPYYILCWAWIMWHFRSSLLHLTFNCCWPKTFSSTQGVAWHHVGENRKHQCDDPGWSDVLCIKSHHVLVGITDPTMPRRKLDSDASDALNCWWQLLVSTPFSLSMLPSNHIPLKATADDDIKRPCGLGWRCIFPWRVSGLVVISDPRAHAVCIGLGRRWYAETHRSLGAPCAICAVVLHWFSTAKDSCTDLLQPGYWQ